MGPRNPANGKRQPAGNRMPAVQTHWTCAWSGNLDQVPNGSRRCYSTCID